MNVLTVINKTFVANISEKKEYPCNMFLRIPVTIIFGMSTPKNTPRKKRNTFHIILYCRGPPWTSLFYRVLLSVSFQPL